MRFIVAILLMVSGLFCPAYALANEEAEEFAEEYAQELKRHTFEIGSEAYYFKYEEPGEMKENGIMYGLNGAYTFYDRIMLKAEARYAWGEVDYKNSGTLNGIYDYTLEFRGLAGWGFPVGISSLLTPYVGLGYRYLNDDLEGKTTSTGALGYERESNYFYTPVGIQTLTELTYDWSLGLNVEYDYLWKGRQKSHLRDVDPDFNDLENDQNKGFGLRGSLKLIKKGEKIDFVIEPFVRYWNIKKSEEQDVTYSGVVIGYGYEPKNNTTEMGVKLAVNF